MTQGSRTVLIAEDDKVNRMKLQRFFTKEMATDVLVAEDGEQAWELFKANDVRFVVTDWMMPKCDGPELCERIRECAAEHYTYIILLTGRTEQEDLLIGMAAGADDYVRKPFDPAELQLRVKAGFRVIELEQTLEQQNSELEAAYDALSEALKAAGRTQLKMLPDRELIKQIRQNSGLEIAFSYQACQSLGGDVFGVEALPDGSVALFLADVSGHGIEASLSAVGMHTCIRTSLQTSPEIPQLIDSVNKFCCEDFPPEIYATFVYLHVYPDKRSISTVVAGHPPLQISRGSGGITEVHSTMPPVGLFEDAAAGIEVVHLDIERSDRVIGYTDGLIETKNRAGDFFAGKVFTDAIEGTAKTEIKDIPTYLVDRIQEFSGTDDGADDDITIFAFGLN